MWTGVDIQTALDPDRIRLAVLEQVAESKGRIELTADTPLLLACDISRLKGTVKFSVRGKSDPWVTFDIQISDESAGRRAVRTHIVQALLGESSVPFGPSKMDGNKAYMDFARALGAKVSAADVSAHVSLREGGMPADFDLSSLQPRVSPPPSGPSVYALAHVAGGPSAMAGGEKVRYCTGCGSPVRSGSAFCASCGAKTAR
jgi:hypothetical protein